MTIRFDPTRECREVCLTCRFIGHAALHIGPPGEHRFYRVIDGRWSGEIVSTFRQVGRAK